MKKATKRQARARRVTLKQRRAKIGQVLLDQWIGAGRHRNKIVSHAIDAALSLMAIDEKIDLSTITVILASNQMTQLITMVQAVANSVNKTADEVAGELCEQLHDHHGMLAASESAN